MVSLPHPIRVVARLTGLSPHVIRVWEKRYAAVTPERTATNRRLYSEDEVERLGLLRRATEAGHQIGMIARLGAEDLRRLIASVDESGRGLDRKGRGRGAGNGNGNPVDAGPSSRTGGDGEGVVVEALSAMRAFRSDDLLRALHAGVVRFGHNGVLHRVIHPLARQMGELWQTGEITSAHEHFASAVIRNFLLDGARSFGLGEGAPRVGVASPAGQLHELGAVMAAAAATHLGWRAIYLGPSLPAAEIAGAAIQNRARVVLLSLVYPADDPRLGGELDQLRRYLPAEVAIVAGGRASGSYAAALAGIQALTPAGLPELVDLLESMRSARI